ncbi:MAG: hypothetical protein ACUVUC_05815 [Thermoguttaceae bacterium]
MRTIRVVLAAALALSMAGALVAQEQKKEKGKPGKLSPTAQAMLRMERLRTVLEQLDLTAEQKEKVAKIRQEVGPRMKELFGKMREILTEEQAKAAEEAGRKARDAGKTGRALLEAIEASLKLNAEQQEKMSKLAPDILAIQKDLIRQIRAILTPEQQEKFKEKMGAGQKKQPQKGGKKKTQ